MKKLLFGALGIALLCSFVPRSYSALPLLSFTICKGDGGCSETTHHIGCKDSEVTFTEKVCTVNEGGGKTHVRQYTISPPYSTVGGGECGYTKWRAECASE